MPLATVNHARHLCALPASVFDLAIHSAPEVGERERQEEPQESGERKAARPLPEPATELLSKILGANDCLQELVNQDPASARSQEVVSLLNKAVEVYGKMHSDRINKKRQSLITRFFEGQAAAPLQPADLLREQEERDMDIHGAVSLVSDIDFEGFPDD